MKVLVSGSSGLIGSALLPLLDKSGHHVMRLVRSQPSGPDQIRWDPAAGTVEANGIEGLDAVIHLSGENIAASRWTSEQKKRLRESRVKSTELLAGALARLTAPPKVFVCASAVGYYGDRGGEVLREDSSAGVGFLADMCREWEAATGAARKRGIRVVSLRFGIVLSPAGGALAKMLPPFRAGVGGAIGNGRQYMSWIALDDAVEVIRHALVTEALEGPVNAAAPSAVTNREFTRTLARVLGRPALFTVPTFALRILVGEMAGELVASQRVEPAKLAATGYEFRFPELESALRYVLGRAKSIGKAAPPD